MTAGIQTQTAVQAIAVWIGAKRFDLNDPEIKSVEFGDPGTGQVSVRIVYTDDRKPHIFVCHPVAIIHEYEEQPLVIANSLPELKTEK